MQTKLTYLDTFSESLDLALLALQAIDIYTYMNFLEELSKSKYSPNLIIVILKLRFNYRLTSNNYCYKQLKSKKLTEKITPKEIKEIIVSLSKVLKNNFCSEKIEYLFFYFMTEKSIFISLIKIISIKNLFLFEFWILEYEKRFTLIFLKIHAKPWNKKFYKTLITIYLRKSLLYLIFYKNI
jgi:hypothetical protein